ncbi:MAG: glycosyltransferase family 4 protein [Roseiflexaceae bacterium]
MRIGLIVPGFSADADDWCIPALRQLAIALAAEHDLQILTLRYPHRRHTYSLFGSTITALGSATRSGLASIPLWVDALQAIARLHRQHRFDLLHAFWASEAGALAALAGRILRIPSLINLAGGELANLPAIGYGGRLVRSERLKVAIALRLGSQHAAGSAYACAMVERLTQRPCHELPLGIDSELFHPAEPSANTASNQSPRLVQVASLLPVKGQEVLIAALAQVRDQGLPFCCELIGSGPCEDALRAQIEQLGLTGQIQIRGFFPHDALPALYQGATAFVLSSYHEAQCMALIEAAACGVPTIGSAVGVLPEFAPHAAIATPPGDATALATAITTLLRSPAQQRQLATAALQHARQHYTLATTSANTLALYRQLIASC